MWSKEADGGSNPSLIELPVLLWDDPDPSWRADAACGPLGDELQTDRWFTVGAGQTVAASVCNDICPVKDRCLEFALRNRIMWGTWGGLTQEELRAAHRASKDADIWENAGAVSG